MTFAIGTNTARQAFLDSYYEYVKKVIPDLEVVYVSGSSSKVLTMIAGGIPPEMQRIGMETYQEFAAAGVLEDITWLIKLDHIDLNDFSPAFAKAIVFNGGIYAMPSNVNPTVMYWSPSQFARHGVAPPPTRYGDPSWTWEAIKELAKKFTIDTNGDGIPDNWGVAGNPRSEVTRIGSAWGARFMDDDFRFCGNTLEMTKALEFFADWIQNAKTITLNTKPFDQGNAAIKLGDTAATLPQYHLQGKEYRIAPVPTGHIPDLYSAGIRFFKGANIELAWEYIKPMVLEPEWTVGKAIALTNLGIGFDAVGVHEYVDRRESPDYVKDTALAHGWYASQLNKDALIGEFNWRYLARESEAAQAEHFYEIVDALLSQRSIDIFMQYKLSDTYSIQPEQQKGIRHYELLRLDRTLKPQGYKYLELVRKYGDPQAPINVLRITMPEISIEPDNWRTLTATLHNAGTQTLETPLTWDLPAEVEMRDVGPAGLHLEPGETATLSVQVRLKEGSRPGFYHLFLQTAVHGRILFGWSSAAYTAQPELDTQSAEFVGVKYVNGPAVLENVDFIRPGAIVLGDSTEELEWSYALYNTLRAATGNTLIDRVDAPDLGDRIKENLFVVGWCGGLAGKLLPAENMALKGNETIVYIGPNPYNSESKVVVFYGADPGRAVSDFIYRYWQFAKDAVTFDARIGPAIVDPAVVR
ncbi:MAG: ABC transporter substrate-binding protein [Limnochordia bacterium]